MKVLLKNAFFLYLIAASITGCLYKLLNGEEFTNWANLIIENVIYILIAIIFSYLGYLKDKQKGDKKKQ